MKMNHKLYRLIPLLLLVGVIKGHAQQTRLDTTKTQQIKEVVVTADKHNKNVGEIKRTAEQLRVEMLGCAFDFAHILIVFVGRHNNFLYLLRLRCVQSCLLCMTFYHANQQQQ